MVEKSADMSPYPANVGPANPSRAEQQMTKMKDTNAKYKSLLKMAKERIQTQEDEKESLRLTLKKTNNELEGLKATVASKTEHRIKQDSIYSSHEYDIPSKIDASESRHCTVVRVCQLIKADANHDSNEFHEQNNRSISSNTTIWALIEYEVSMVEMTEGMFATPAKRFSRWRRFPSESSLSDHVRRDSGEPVSLPPFSLSPIQSQQLEKEARQAVVHITEEFRRFRVRSEVARKQSDAIVRSLQSKNVQKTQMQIEGQDIASELEEAKIQRSLVTNLKAEMGEQEAHWKQAYDALLAENNSLKSSGSEALLAAQWRQRYESCFIEKEKTETALEIEKGKKQKINEDLRKEDSGKYEAKYKDLKESFRLYRKKAKEVFAAQQNGDGSMIDLGDKGSEDAKISYLRNLMVNYLSSDPAVRGHMEGAIGTVLKFSDGDLAKISKQKEHGEAWFNY